MPKYKDEVPAVRVYTVCDESKYLIVRNVPELGCGDELLNLFSTYGKVEECKPMDDEECEPFTDVYWIKFHQVNNARFAKRKLDEYVFLGNRLQVSYAHQYESLLDTREKLEGRRNEVLARLNPGKFKGSSDFMSKPSSVSNSVPKDSLRTSSSAQREIRDSQSVLNKRQTSTMSVPFDKEYFPSESMNRTVHLVREKLNKIQQSSVGHGEPSSSKKMRVDNRRRI
ncbi:uncharacterized protein [Henckelia pumila]|uniref:uncharacterized protein isoform X1 n=1 Tax=Henckelia pumila TaxID=405737 RepID=UPI003C6E34CE